MAIIGVSKPYCAKYSNDGDVVTYSEGGSLGMAIDVDIEIDISEDNNLYADNGIAETDRAFSGGTLTVSTDDLSQEVSKLILGIKEQSLEEIPGITDTDVSELIMDDDLETPYLGFGVIIKKQKKNVVRWRAVVLTKIMFAVPDDAATTQEKSIEWQTPELTATILRDDTAKHMWKREATFTTEKQAETYIKHVLGQSSVEGV